MIPWKEISDISALDTIHQNSHQQPQLIFKHSTRCSISAMALERLNRKWKFTDSQITPYYLDLLQHRDISNKIAEKWQVHHESPQILIIRNGECVHDASHSDISVEEIEHIL
jgi:bacillithiol system protein YtxJ